MFQICPIILICDVSEKKSEKNMEVPVMEETVDLGWLVVITSKSRINKLRISAAMDMSSFVAFESAEDDSVPA
jgi:hypothetical protein